MKDRRLTADYLKEIVNYDGATGEFHWKKRIGIRISVGKRAGTTLNSGHRKLTIHGTQHLEHRLAWLYVHGQWPIGEIDHIDGNPSNNKIANLRDVSHKANMENITRPRKNSASGVLGVEKHRNKWAARLKSGAIRIYLGSFDTPEEAHAAYVAAKRAIHAGCTI